MSPSRHGGPFLLRSVLILMAGVVFLAVPTIASAHAGNNDPNVIHACIASISKLVRIVGVTGTCITSPPPQAETPAHWDIQGPAGANGINGTNGTDGTNGTSVTFLGTFSGTDHGCPNGGTILGTANGNAYVCNGTNGVTGGAAGPCFDNTNRYVDCGNGTVTDTVTGLIWLKQSDCLATTDWTSANQAAAALKSGDCGGTANPLSDGSAAGDWRLPTKDEWIATVADAKARGCISSAGPSLTNDAATGCLSVGPTSFAGVASTFYWSNTSYVIPIYAWSVTLETGFVQAFATKDVNGLRVWPVRSGSR